MSDTAKHDDDVVPICQAVSEIAGQVPDEDWAKVPRDLAQNLDHYLYGSPTVEDAETTG